MRRTRLFAASGLLLLLLALAACGTTGPSFDTAFPFMYLQDIDTAAEPVACDFMGSSGCAIVAAGTHIYFIDHDQGYVLADVATETGNPLTDVCSTSEGGFAVGVAGQVLVYVSNDTYQLHDQISLGRTGLFLAAKPSGTVMWVVCGDGSVVTVSTVTWNISNVAQTAVVSPAGAAVDASGSRLFVADASDSTVKMLSTAGFSLLAQEDIPGGAADLCPDPAGGVWVACGSGQSPFELWHLDSGTGLHDGTVPLPGDPRCVAVTPDGAYFFTGLPQETLVLDPDGTVEASDDGNFSPASDMAICGDGQRTVVCRGGGYHQVFMLERL